MNAPIESASGSSTYSKMKLELSDFSESDQWPGPWKLIVDWYRALLPDGRDRPASSAFGADTDIAIATQPESFWNRDPDEVMADIGHIVAGEPPLFDPRSTETADAGNTEDVFDPKSDDPTDTTADDKAERALVEETRTQFDHPTDVDGLARRPFALELVRRMDEMRAETTPDGFALNLHGPWGAGKSSVLLMMDQALRDPERATDDPWAVVHFNAWQHERRNPPWWPLIEAVKDGCMDSLKKDGQWMRGNDVRHVWRQWIFRAEWLPVLGGVFALLAAMIVYAALPPSAVKDVFAAIGFLITLYGGGRLLIRQAFFGSMSNEEFYLKVAKDPMKKVCELFRDLVETTDRHVCIFIDDLDRCNADYVVDLLEGIQTSFRHEKVAYLVAADKTWIRAAFEKRYPEFTEHVGNLGQPLGYLFLEKIFQMSVPIPGMGDWKQRYLDGLLGKADAAKAEGAGSARDRAKSFDEGVSQRRAELKESYGSELGSAMIDQELAQADPDDEYLRAAVVAEESASSTVRQETEHLLSRFAGLLPDNPRVMKRMINAFGMRRAIIALEGSDVSREVLARWTVLEQRFPALADLLTEHPDAADPLAISSADSDDIPPALKPYAEVLAVQAILAGTLSKDGADMDAPPLDAEAVRQIVRGAMG
ncbi:KAP family P-loop domain-containing protein [Stappia sp. ES.058]|nr:KAP family P-loop domain-containing protein [Stappia sp. ES.058]